MCWEKVGEIGVDAGLCWVGDPCYILHREKNPQAIGNNWAEFCDKLGEGFREVQFHYDVGHAGLGVCVSTGYGDGCYPVYVERQDDGRVKAVKVVFIEDEEEEEQDTCQCCGGETDGDELCDECFEDWE